MAEMAAERGGAVWLAALVVLALAASARAVAGCPPLCECKWRSGKESALCARAGLPAVPARLASTTQLLDLSENRLGALRDDAFAAAGLLNLQRLYLASCGLRSVRPRAFRALVNLVELDLARNRLDAVPSHSFDPVPELRELTLAGNPITKLKDDAFVKLPNLVRLDLSSCKIVEIDPRSFVGVEASLEYLDLDKNLLRTLHAAALAPLRSLRGLELAGNPWDCSCALRPLRDWMLRKNVPATVTPDCALPPRLMSQSWDRLDLDDFACPPEVSPVMSHANGFEGSEVTLMCRVRGIPAPRVRWFRAGRLVSNNSGTPHITSGRLFMLRGEGQLSNLTIKSAELQDAGAYTCTAENRAGRAEASVTLAMERTPPDKSLGGRALMASVAVCAGVLMCASLFVLYAHETRKRRQLVTWNEQIVSQNRRDENYEKVVSNCKNGDGDIVPRTVVSMEGGRKRGPYRNVPLHDPEEEADVFVREEPPPPPRLWHPASHPAPHSAPHPAPHSAPRAVPLSWGSGHGAREPDLHIPRRSDYMSRRDSPPGAAPSSSTTAADSIIDHNRINNNSRCAPRARPRTRDRLDNDLSGSDSEKNYPDLIEMSSLGSSAGYVRNERSDRRPDPPGYFCTLPRRREGDSRSPLLDSRRNSSGGDSSNSCDRSYEYRSRHKPPSRRSNSFLDLAGGGNRSYRNPSLPTSPNREPVTVPSATPLLDLSGLRDYQTEDFDFRASQLEKFLEEYQSLREHLTIIKETRENIQRSRAAESDELKAVMKGKPSVAVTETSSGALGDASPRPEWMSALLYRN